MAKLYFHYSTMNAGKSTLLLQAAHNYLERGMKTYLLTAHFDHRAGEGKIASRIGVEKAADTFATGENLYQKIERRLSARPCDCIFFRVGQGQMDCGERVDPGKNGHNRQGKDYSHAKNSDQNPPGKKPPLPNRRHLFKFVGIYNGVVKRQGDF